MTPESIRSSWSTTYDQLNGIVSFLNKWIKNNDLLELKNEMEAITTRLQSDVDADPKEINALRNRKLELEKTCSLYPKYNSIYDSIVNDIASIQPKEIKKYTNNYRKAIEIINLKDYSSSISASSKIAIINFK